MIDIDNGTGSLNKIRISICSNWRHCLENNECFHNELEKPKYCGFWNSEIAREKYKQNLGIISKKKIVKIKRKR